MKSIIRGIPNSAPACRSYEMAYRMQRYAPDAVDLCQESEKTQELYGINEKPTEDFGRRCLLARRLVERGVRFIQLYAGGANNDDNWDAHGDLVHNHTFHAGRTDKPIAGLLKDLKQRGLLDETLVVWGGEFGRQPTAENAKRHRPRSQRLRALPCGWPAAASRAEPPSAKPTNSALPPSPIASTSSTSTPLSCIKWASIPNRLTYFYGGLDQSWSAWKGPNRFGRLLRNTLSVERPWSVHGCDFGQPLQYNASFNEGRIMTALADDPSIMRQDWLGDIQNLMTEIRGWCDAHGWAVNLTEKPISESKLGEYSAPTLQLRASNGGVVYVEPVARYVAGANGLVDIYAWPSLRRFLLVRRHGSWTVKTDSGVPLPWKWSEPSFLQVIEALTSAV